MHSNHLQTGSWARSKVTTAREPTAEIQTLFPATFQHQGASMNPQTSCPYHAGGLGQEGFRVKSVPRQFLRGSQGKGAALLTAPWTRDPPSTWSRGGAAAAFRARLPHTERELGLVRATAVLNAIYYPVDTGTRKINQWTVSHRTVSQCPHTETAGAGPGGLGPQEKGDIRSLPLGACSFTGNPTLRHETAREF